MMMHQDLWLQMQECFLTLNCGCTIWRKCEITVGSLPFVIATHQIKDFVSLFARSPMEIQRLSVILRVFLKLKHRNIKSHQKWKI